MMKYFTWLLFLTSCSSSMGSFLLDELPLISGSSTKKQKQRVMQLQKKLELAEQEQKKAETEVENLSREICKAQLALIRKQVDETEKQIEGLKNHPQKKGKFFDDETLFIEEREALQIGR